MKTLVTIPSAAKGARLSDYLAAHGYAIQADCGGRGVCGKCTVVVQRGVFFEDAALQTVMDPAQDGRILSCRAFCGSEEAEVLLLHAEGNGVTVFTGSAVHISAGEENMGYGVALDIGTTTLAAELIDCTSGSVLARVSRLNPQRSFGADVMSRISAADTNLSVMQELLLQAVREMTAELCAACPSCVPQTMTVAGNPTMLHLFCGDSPAGIGRFPFTPVFIETRTCSGETLSLPFGKVTILPSASAFIGSDITAGAAVCHMEEDAAPSLLIDIGTNGEMMLCMGKNRGGAWYAASAAAGPAMEGAGISSGVGGISGAICAVRHTGSMLTFDTVDHAPAIGICGSGLIDCVAVLLEIGEIDETGYMENDPFVLYEDMTRSCGMDISLTQEDVRQFQLAKGAIRAGMDALLSYAHIGAEDIQHVYLAGGLGYYMNTASAVRCGLLPPVFASRTKAVGNSALAGAAAALCNAESCRQISRIAAQCDTVDLNASAVFQEAFINHMVFPEEDCIS